MLVFLLLMLSIQQAKSCEPKQQPILRRTDLQDCTKTFTNRIASFESGLFPSRWMYPFEAHHIEAIYYPAIYSTSTDLVKSDKTYHWFLHGCGSGKVCMEAKRSGWEDYYIHHKGKIFTRTSRGRLAERRLEELIRDTNLYAGSNKEKEIEIWCTSCTPERDNLTYSDCQLVTRDGKQEMLHPISDSEFFFRNEYQVIRSRRGSADMFKWRILSPETRQYWETALAADNCAGQVDLKASHTVTSSITRTTSTTETIEVSAKISLGLEAAKVLKMLGAEAGISYSWSTTSTTEAAEGRSTTLEGVVKPGYKWIVKQLVGEAGYTKIKSLDFTAKNVKCT